MAYKKVLKAILHEQVPTPSNSIRILIGFCLFCSNIPRIRLTISTKCQNRICFLSHQRQTDEVEPLLINSLDTNEVERKSFTATSSWNRILYYLPPDPLLGYLSIMDCGLLGYVIQHPRALYGVDHACMQSVGIADQ